MLNLKWVLVFVVSMNVVHADNVSTVIINDSAQESTAEVSVQEDAPTKPDENMQDDEQDDNSWAAVVRNLEEKKVTVCGYQVPVGGMVLLWIRTAVISAIMQKCGPQEKCVGFSNSAFALSREQTALVAVETAYQGWLYGRERAANTAAVVSLGSIGWNAVTRSGMPQRSVNYVHELCSINRIEFDPCEGLNVADRVAIAEDNLEIVKLNHQIRKSLNDVIRLFMNLGIGYIAEYAVSGGVKATRYVINVVYDDNGVHAQPTIS